LRSTSQVGLLKTKNTLEQVVVGISCLDACFMYGTRDRICFVSGSARFHRHGEQWHESLPTMKDGRAGHSGLTERPILNELNVIVAEGAEKGSKVIVYSSEELARATSTLLAKSSSRGPMKV
jgi:hypothetical protein